MNNITTRAKPSLGLKFAVAIGGAVILSAWGAIAPWIGVMGAGTLVAKVFPNTVRVAANLDEYLGYAAIAMSFVLVTGGGLVGFIISFIGPVGSFWKRWLGIALAMLIICIGVGVAGAAGL